MDKLRKNKGGYATYTVSVSSATPVEAQVYSGYKAFPAGYYIWVRGVGYGTFRVYGSVSATSGMKPFDARVSLDM